MSLKSSSYATMALRELLKCDTSSQTHAAQSAAFHEAHEKSEEAERNKKQTEASKNGDLTEDEEKTVSVSNASSLLEDSGDENAIKHSSSLKVTQKHEVDPINDSGIETGTTA